MQIQQMKLQSLASRKMTVGNTERVLHSMLVFVTLICAMAMALKEICRQK